MLQQAAVMGDHYSLIGARGAYQDLFRSTNQLLRLSIQAKKQSPRGPSIKGGVEIQMIVPTNYPPLLCPRFDLLRSSSTPGASLLCSRARRAGRSGEGGGLIVEWCGMSPHSLWLNKGKLGLLCIFSVLAFISMQVDLRYFMFNPHTEIATIFFLAETRSN